MVVNCGISPTYFLDEMQEYEVQAVINQNHLNYRNSWEQTRFLATVTANSQGIKIKPEKLLKFDWDKKKPVEQKSLEQLQAERQALITAFGDYNKRQYKSFTDKDYLDGLKEQAKNQ